MFLDHLIKKVFEQFRQKLTPQIIAKQLRQPKGKLGVIISNKMNESNRALYEFTIHAMQIQDSQSILEIGFGNGLFFNSLFSSAKNLRISGIDFSADMVKLATRNNEDLIQASSLDLQFGDCEILPFESNTFDKVFCINVVYFWDNPSDNLSEIHRVLKPGGLFYTSIRDEETMQQMEFTKFGFNLIRVDQWSNLLVKNRFSTELTHTFIEPTLEANGMHLKPKSHCIAAKKI